jgi:hypothetical protein
LTASGAIIASRSPKDLQRLVSESNDPKKAANPKQVQFLILLILTRGKKMANNFKMNIHRRIDKLTICLIGDFDGTSAFELLNALSENLNNAKYIQIDTKKLQEVYPFGKEVFYHKFLKMKTQRNRIRFIGPVALHMAPTDR